MNRIRAAYMEMAPELKRYFVMGTTDDERGVNLTMAVQPGTPLLVQMLASTPLLVTMLNGVLAAGIVGLIVLQLGGATGVAVGLGIVTFVVVVAGFIWYAGRDIARVIAEYRPLFPGAPDDERPVP